MADDKNVWSQVTRYSELAFILPAATLAGWVFGYFLDKLFHTHFLYVVFLFLGIVAGFIQLIRAVLKEVGPGARQ
jgi:F0F1-type ATP synthase assembly protein I